MKLVIIVDTCQAENFPMLLAGFADNFQGLAKSVAVKLAWDSKLDSKVIRANQDDIRALDRCYVIDVVYTFFRLNHQEDARTIGVRLRYYILLWR